jgi:hypothetical protein
MGPAFAERPADNEPVIGPAGSTTAEKPRLVLVPRDPGPVRELDRPGAGSRDDLDELVDDLFGPITDERPGLFDAALLLVGAGLLAWAILTGASGLPLFGAIAAMILGLALPARSLVLAYRRRAAALRQRSVTRHGFVLDVSHPVTAALVAGYSQLLGASRLPGSAYSGRAIEAGHLALVEVASLLAGLPPAEGPQVNYVDKRLHAINALTRQLEGAHRSWLSGQAAEEARNARRARLRETAITQAREELQAADHFGSLDQLGRLTARLEKEAGNEEV